MREFIDQTTPPRGSVPVIERQIAQCILQHPTDDTFLIFKKLSWETETWSFPVGGIEDDETPKQAAARETIEESGYHDFGELTEVSEPYVVIFYQERKKENRHATVYTFATRLRSLDQQPLDPEEAALHEPHWLPADEVLAKVHGEGCKLVFGEFLASRGLSAK